MAVRSVLFAVLFVVVIIAHGDSAPTESGNDDIRDNAEAEALKTKLKKLHELLQELFSEDRQAQTESETNSESAVTSEDMVAQVQDLREEATQAPKVEDKQSLQQPKTPALQQSEDRSEFEGLVEALERFRLSRQNDRRNHVSRGDVRGQTSVMEDVVSRALERLGQEEREAEEEAEREAARLAEKEAEKQAEREAERQKEMEAQKEKNSSSEDADMDPLYEIFHAKAMEAVEQKLLEDIRAGAELGVSVDMLIADLQDQDVPDTEEEEAAVQQLTGLRRRKLE